MSTAEKFRRMDSRLRVMLIAAGLLVVPQIGQFIAIRDINTSGHESTLALLFMVLAIFIVPTSLILAGAVIYSVRASWRHYERLLILGAIVALIAANIIWFFVAPCVWSQVFGIVLHTCHR